MQYQEERCCTWYPSDSSSALRLAMRLGIFTVLTHSLLTQHADAYQHTVEVSDLTQHHNSQSPLTSTARHTALQACQAHLAVMHARTFVKTHPHQRKGTGLCRMTVTCLLL